MRDKEILTVNTLKKLLDALSDGGYGDMSIVLGRDTPILEDAIGVDYSENRLLIRNTYYDKQLADAAEELKISIGAAVKHYYAECYRAGMNVKGIDIL